MAMELDNSFSVPVPPEQAWDVLLDVKRIAPCMPGATVDEVEGDVVNGHIKVKVGPVSLTYRGTATFTERDADARVVVVEASGKETRGAGTASATVRASLEPDASGNGTLVTMHTTMNVTGRPAQFGRGVMVEVGGKLVDQFAANLAAQIVSEGAGDGGAAAGATAGTSADSAQAADGSADRSGGATVAHQDGAGPAAGSTAAGGTVTAAPPAPSAPAEKQESINLVRLVGPAILKRVVPVAAIAAALAFLGRRLMRRGRGKGAGEA
jgi:carbon monoxide dehydrogenase subunit G